MAGKLLHILQPFIFGGVIAYILRPICNWLEDKLLRILPGKLKNAASATAVAVSLIFGLLVVGVLLWLVIPQLYITIVSLYNTLPEKFDLLIQHMEEYLENNEALTNNLAAVYETVKDSVFQWIKTSVIPRLDSIVSGVGNGAWNSIIVIKNLLIGIVVSVYFLGGRKTFARQSKLIIYSIFKKKWAEKILDEVHYADQMFTGFINGKLFDSFIIGIACFIFCLIVKMPNALLISVIIGFTNIIPFFGPFIGAIPSAILILVDSPIKAVWFIIFVIVIQTIDGNVLGPKILGDRIGLSSFWVLFGILLFGGLFGFVGMLVGVPLFAVIYDILRKLVDYGLERHGCDRKQLMSEDMETERQDAVVHNTAVERQEAVVHNTASNENNEEEGTEQ
jgi:predicted PurR-regulated permease PerM